MASNDQIRQIYERYPELVSKGDVDAIVALYHEDATIEDPIGSELVRGIDGIRRFYEANAGAVTIELGGPVLAAANEGAVSLVILIGPEGSQQRLDAISMMTFDDDAKITSMRAIWNADQLGG